MTRAYSLEVGPWNWIVCGKAVKSVVNVNCLMRAWHGNTDTQKKKRHISRRTRVVATRVVAWIRGAQAYGGLGGLHFPRRIPYPPNPTLPSPWPTPARPNPPNSGAMIIVYRPLVDHKLLRATLTIKNRLRKWPPHTKMLSCLWPTRVQNVYANPTIQTCSKLRNVMLCGS